MPKKKFRKWAFLDQNRGETLWKNVNFSTFSTSCFYNLERQFIVLECHKRHFPGLYCLKKKIGKMAIFGENPWVNPFEKISKKGHFWRKSMGNPLGKMSIFRLFKLPFFIA